VGRIARGAALATDLGNLERWTGQVAGRGACRHPDGAAQMLASAMDVFREDIARHVRTGRCGQTGSLLGVA
jgi:NADH:ubiquinone oxidoreductase subunit F (NADH-binding)